MPRICTRRAAIEEVSRLLQRTAAAVAVTASGRKAGMAGSPAGHGAEARPVARRVPPAPLSRAAGAGVAGGVPVPDSVAAVSCLQMLAG